MMCTQLCIRFAPHRSVTVLLSGLAFGLVLTAPAHADDKAGREARRFQELQQRYEQERQSWQSEREALQRKIDDAQSALATEKDAEAKLKAELGALQKARTDLSVSLQDLSHKLADTSAGAAKKAAEDQSTLERFTQARVEERKAMNARYESQTRTLNACLDKNQSLLKISHELLAKYEHKDVFDALRQDDPFLGLKQTDVFNEVQDYSDKIDAQKADTVQMGK